MARSTTHIIFVGLIVMFTSRGVDSACTNNTFRPPPDSIFRWCLEDLTLAQSYWWTYWGLTKVPTLSIPADSLVVDLEGNAFTNITQNAFSHLVDCTHLFLEHNTITSVQPGAWNGLVSLEFVWLNNNRLTQLDSNMFAGLNNLQGLELCCNQISTIQTGAFNGLSSLLELHLNGNQLTEIESGIFGGLTALGTLSLFTNQISTIQSGSFDDLTSLNHLSLAENNLTQVNINTFSGVSALITLRLQNNSISHIDPLSFNNLISLTELYLYNNKLTQLHSNTFSGLSNLEEFWIHTNLLSSIAAGAFSQLGSVQKMLFGHNDFSILNTNMFSGMSQLVLLDCAASGITTIRSGAFYGLQSLLFLFLNKNEITTIESGAFDELDFLQNFTLSTNKLTHLSSNMFLGMPNLLDLKLDTNDIVTLELGAFNGLPALLTLGLWSNSLGQIKNDSFLPLATLLELDLQNNKISIIESGAFNGLVVLKLLWLDLNELTTLAPEVLAPLPRPLELTLSDNSLACDTLCWLKQEERTGTVTWLTPSFQPDCSGGGASWNTLECGAIVECPDPGTVPNSRTIGDIEPFGSGDRVTFICNECFSGGGSITCESDEQWSSSKPNCTAVVCQNPGDINNGVRFPVLFTYSCGDQITYTCDSGHILTGQSTIECGSNGQFDSTPPACVLEEKCTDPGNVANSQRAGAVAPFNTNDQLTFTCVDCYKGSETITCLESGQWSGSPTCTEVVCFDPGEIENGVRDVVVAPTHPCRTEVTFTCDEGFILNGLASLRCEPTGQFNAQPPTCTTIPKDCKGIECPGIRNGVIGAVVALLVIIVVLVVLAVCCYKKRKTDQVVDSVYPGFPLNEPDGPKLVENPNKPVWDGRYNREPQYLDLRDTYYSEIPANLAGGDLGTYMNDETPRPHSSPAPGGLPPPVPDMTTRSIPGYLPGVVQSGDHIPNAGRAPNQRTSQYISSGGTGVKMFHGAFLQGKAQ